MNSPIDAQRKNLGEARFRKHMEVNALLHFNALALNMAVLTAAQLGYSDAAIEAIRVDADDLEEAARDFADYARELASYWKAQREELEPW